MTKEKLLKAEEVALLIGSSVRSIDIWYRWKREDPDHELAKLLPDYIQEGSRQTRYWKNSDVWKLIKFKQSLPHGRNGILGKITQKYTKKGE